MNRPEETASAPGTPARAVAPAARRVERTLGLVLFVVYASFFQGGGWNQNARLDQVRAIAEAGTFRIDDYLRYEVRPTGGGGPELVRLPLPEGARPRRIDRIANSGDLAHHPPTGAWYPVKPPGSALLAVPGHLFARALLGALGERPDGWTGVTVSAYLATVFSVGLAGALGGVLFLRLSRRLFPAAGEPAHAAAALTLGLATLVLPFSTAFFDHVPAAFLGLAAFAAAVRAAEAPGGSDRGWLATSGAAAGGAVLVSYPSVLVVVLVGLYLLAVSRPRRRVLWYVAGGLPAAVGLGLYHLAAFGTPWTWANVYQRAQFVTPGRALGVFGAPDPEVLWRLLASPERGLFFLSPVLGAGAAWALLVLLRRGGGDRGEPSRRPEMALALAVFAAFWLMNGAFNVWTAGWSFGPRLLIPAVPFLALALAPLYARAPRALAALAVVSFLPAFLATAVDMQPPPEVGRPLSDHVLPLFAGETVTVGRFAVAGPVSANPIGVYEGWFYRGGFGPGSREVAWNSFNLGELLFPGSRWSLVPILAGIAAGVARVMTLARAATGAPGPARRAA